MAITKYQQACDEYQKTEEAYAAVASRFVTDFTEAFADFLECDRELVVIEIQSLRRERIPQPEWSLIGDFTVSLQVQMPAGSARVSHGGMQFFTEDFEAFVIKFGKAVYDMEDGSRRAALFKEIYRHLLEQCKYH